MTTECDDKTVLLVEDDRDYRAITELRLLSVGCSVLTAADGEEGLIQWQRHTPPVVLTDVVMPKIDGMSLLKIIKSVRPATEVIVLTGQGDIPLAVEAMRRGASDFLVKTDNDDKLEETTLASLKRVAMVERFSGPTAHADPLDELQPSRIKEAYWSLRRKEIRQRLSTTSLTEREIEIVFLVAKGKSDQEIADEINVSYHTVKKHLQNVFRKMEVPNRVELILQVT